MNLSSKKQLYLFIGLDFGTSCTKVVLRTPYDRDRVFAVPFLDAAHPSSPYLLPTELWIDQHGRASLTQFASATRIRDLKGHFVRSLPLSVPEIISPSRTIDSQVASAGYLALTLRHIRQWFLHSHSTDYGKYEPV